MTGLRQYAHCDWCGRFEPVDSTAAADHWLRTHPCPRAPDERRRGAGVMSDVCRHCGEPIHSDNGEDWLHDHMLMRCQRNVAHYGPVAEPEPAIDYVALEAELDELERTDPSVKRAADNYRAAVDDILGGTSTPDQAKEAT